MLLCLGPRCRRFESCHSDQRKKRGRMSSLFTLVEYMEGLKGAGVRDLQWQSEPTTAPTMITVFIIFTAYNTFYMSIISHYSALMFSSIRLITSKNTSSLLPVGSCRLQLSSKALPI